MNPATECAAPLIGKSPCNEPHALVHPVTQRDARHPVLLKRIVKQHGTSPQSVAPGTRQPVGRLFLSPRHQTRLETASLPPRTHPQHLLGLTAPRERTFAKGIKLPVDDNCVIILAALSIRFHR